MLKLKINVKVPQLLCIVVSVSYNAPINVKPLGGGRPGIGGAFELS